MKAMQAQMGVLEQQLREALQARIEALQSQVRERVG